MTGAVMFVCTANVCRSPLMQFVFDADAPDYDSVSRGIEVSAGADRVCAVVAANVIAPAGDTAFVDAHSPTQIAIDDVDASDLIITASATERAHVVHLRPDARDRVFTLREALLLARDQPTAQERAALSAAEPHDSSARRYARLLHSRRGRTMPAARRRLALPLRRAADPLDIPDAHHIGRREHRRMIADVQGEIADFAAGLTRFAADAQRRAH